MGGLVARTVFDKCTDQPSTHVWQMHLLRTVRSILHITVLKLPSIIYINTSDALLSSITGNVYVVLDPESVQQGRRVAQDGACVLGYFIVFACTSSFCFGFWTATATIPESSLR